MKRAVVMLCAGALGLLAGGALAETDFMEVAPPAQLAFQYFPIYQHVDSFSRDDIPVDDLDVDVFVNLFRLAKWWDNGVAHVILPVVYADQDVMTNTPGGPLMLNEGSNFGIGDVFIGGGPRFISEQKDLFIVPGVDLRLPTGTYESHHDPGADDFIPGKEAMLGSGALAVQPFVIVTKLFENGLLASDTECRFDLETTAGPVDYNPDDGFELWQNFSIGLAENFRVGGLFKAEFEMDDDDKDGDRAWYMETGPGAMIVFDGGIVLWSKVMFDVAGNDSAEDSVKVYFRLSIPVGP